MTKGSGPGRWIALAALAILVLVLAVVALPDGDDQADSNQADTDQNAAPGDGSRPSQRGQSEDPSADAGPGGGSREPESGAGIAFRPDSIAIDDTSVWVSDWACGVVVRIDRASEEVVGVVDLGGAASGIAVADGSVWVGNRDLARVVRLNPDTTTIERVIDLPGYALGLAASDNQVWATDPVSNAVHRIDAITGTLLDTTPVGGAPHHIAIDGTSVWVTNSGTTSVSRLDVSGPVPAVEAEIPVGNYPLHVEVGDGSAWVTNGADASVHRIDIATGQTQDVIPVGFFPHALAWAGGSVWVGTEAGELWRIDPTTNDAVFVDDARFSSIDMAVDGDEIWVADADASSIVRFDATAGRIASTVDLLQYGDCETFRDQAVVPPVNEAVGFRPAPTLAPPPGTVEAWRNAGTNSGGTHLPAGAR